MYVYIVYPTVEVRWFYPGRIPAQTWNWFNQDRSIEPVPERVDHYLRKTGESLGVKLRQGFIEVKQHSHFYGPVLFHQAVQGQVEAWNKWSFPLSVDDEYIEPTRESSAWLGIKKQRYIRLYVASRKVKEVLTSQPPACGCGWELARISIIGRSGIWWTLAYEAFGAGKNLKDTLFTVIAYTMGSAPPSLQIEVSSGYPAWIYALDR